LKRFQFELEEVLEFRVYREKEAEIELGRAMGILAEIENRIKALAAERVQAAADRFSAKNSAAEILAFDLYIRRLDVTRDRLLEEAAKAELKVAAAREAFLAASQDRKVLDKLKEQRQKEYRKLMFAEETKVLDDISGGTAARRQINA
jgi:flagellar FliJ protein